MRSFIALELPEGPKKAAAEVMARLKPDGPDVKWVKPQGLHLTLKFLGEVKPEMVGDLSRCLDQACAGRGALELGLSGAGAFPGPNRPQVVWLGMTGQLEELAALKTAIERQMETLGFAPEERPFRPHLTLGRLRRARGKRQKPDTRPLSLALAGLSGFAGPDFRADRVVLMKSTLTPAGAVYTPLHAVTLGV